jgi:hypothetical protein
MITFLDSVLAGKLEPEDIKTFIKNTFPTETEPLEIHLGFSPEEFALWNEYPNSIYFIVNMHKKKKSTENRVLDQRNRAMALLTSGFPMDPSHKGPCLGIECDGACSGNTHYFIELAALQKDIAETKL